MEGLNFKVADQFSNFFVRDSYGSFIPNLEKLLMGEAERKLVRQLKAKFGFYRRLAAIVERTDVVFTNNPLGNSPVIGVGLKLFGPRPLKGGIKGALSRGQNITPSIQKALDKRQGKIRENTKSLISLLGQLESEISTDYDKLLLMVEKDQSLTGEGFDNNRIGEVHKSGLNFINKGYSYDHDKYVDTVLSKHVVDGCIWVAELLEKQGMVKGSLKPMSGLKVRAEQNTDGTLGYPVMDKSQAEWTVEYANRVLIEYGVDTRMLVGKSVNDKYNGYSGPTRVVDALCYALDAKVWTYNELLNFIVFLARIQKHGCKYEDGELVAKDGKTRSVYLESCLCAMINAMIFTPFNNRMKEIKASIMPSLQDKPTRVDMIWQMLSEAMSADYDFLAADWSKYDAGVLGCILATIVQLVVKPFIHADYHYWVDLATYNLVYKYVIFDTSLASLWKDEFNYALEHGPHFTSKQYTIFGSVDGLISGDKFTHVGGSIYGEVVIHFCVAQLLNYKPIPGPQAGDDTLMGYPKKRIDITDVNKTYQPIADAVAQYNLEMNVGKQIYHNVLGEVVKVFLQDNYHFATQMKGIGSIFRPMAAIFVSEREKGLSIAEQLMAEIARANQGADNPFAPVLVEWWLNKERYLGWLFKEYGVNGFRKLVEFIGKSIDDIARNVDVGSFSFGVNMEDMQTGNLPILPIMADVASHMTFSSEDKIPHWGENIDKSSDDEGIDYSSEFDDDDNIE